MSGPRLNIPLPVRERQRQASDPAASAWVSANAGSGKTHVLTQRVLRLLLAGAAPSGLLCLTFTKTAAANMAARVFETLPSWTGARRRGLERSDRRTRRAEAGRAEARLRPPPVRARDRDPGRVEDPDDPRLLRTPAASLPVRGQCPGELQRRRRSRGGGADRRSARPRLRRRTSARPSAPRRSNASRATPAPRASTNCSPRRWRAAPSSTRIGDAEAYAAALRRALDLAADETSAAIKAQMLALAPQWAEWADELDDGSANDRELAGRACAGRSPRRRRRPRLAAYLDAFFTKGRQAARRRETAPRHRRARQAPARACRSASPPSRSG